MGQAVGLQRNYIPILKDVIVFGILYIHKMEAHYYSNTSLNYLKNETTSCHNLFSMVTVKHVKVT
jgi:hypothetical protein